MEYLVDILNQMKDEIYDRQLRSTLIDKDTQEKIENLKVLIPGCGALGSAIAELLARIGVNKFRLIDFDFVEPSNYPRTSSIGLLGSLSKTPKVIACESLLRSLNPFAKIESIYGWISPLNAKKLVDGIDIVMDGLDNLRTRSFIADAAWTSNIPYIYTGVSDYYYNVMPIIKGETPCFDCIFNIPEKEEGGIPVLISTVYMAASTAVMVLLHIIKGSVESSMIIGDAFNFSVDKIPVSQNACECDSIKYRGRKCIIDEFRGGKILYTSMKTLFEQKDLLRDNCVMLNYDNWTYTLSCGLGVLTIFRDGTVLCERGNCNQLIDYIAGKLGCEL
jgi:molybdopterin/thiamine biosynthesis adenylyltransferase